MILSLLHSKTRKQQELKFCLPKSLNIDFILQDKLQFKNVYFDPRGKKCVYITTKWLQSAELSSVNRDVKSALV